MVFRPLPILTGLTVLSLVILIWLGNWQYARYNEKLGMEDAPPLPSQSLSFRLVGEPDQPVQNVYGIADGEAIWRRMAIAEIEGTGRTVLLVVEATGGVNPVPSRVADFGEIARDVRIFDLEGRASARNRPESDTWFVFDRASITARLQGPGETSLPIAEPVDLLIRNAENLSQTRTTTNPYAAPTPIDPLPPQRHFGYALTWWGLAAALFVIYWVFHASRGRLKFRT